MKNLFMVMLLLLLLGMALTIGGCGWCGSGYHQHGYNQDHMNYNRPIGNHALNDNKS